MNKSQKNYFGTTPSEVKNTFLILGFALIVSVLAAYFFRYFFNDIKEYYGESFTTTLYLFFGLVSIFSLNIYPYLNRKYAPRFKKNPEKKISYLGFILVGSLLIFVVPLVFGKMIFYFLSSFSLPLILPFLILLPLSLVLRFFSFHKK